MNIATTYGLWADSYGGTRLRPETDVRVNKENVAESEANRYYDLDNSQLSKLNEFLNENNQYTNIDREFLGIPITPIPTNNCASFARDAVEYVTGEHLIADDWSPAQIGIPAFGVETPWRLKNDILIHEATNPTYNDALEDFYNYFDIFDDNFNSEGNKK